MFAMLTDSRRKSVVAAAIFLALGICPSLSLQEANASEDGAFVEFKVLRPDVALTMAQGALESCHDAGYQVTVAVVDRFGNLQVILRDRFAGAHTIETARGKAWTAVSFRTGTQELDQLISEGELSDGIRRIPGALFLGGGLPVMAEGAIVAGVGVSGAPSPQIDQDCAEAGIEAISDKLDF